MCYSYRKLQKVTCELGHNCVNLVTVGGGADSRRRKMFPQLWIQSSGTHPLVDLRINWQQAGGCESNLDAGS